MLVNRRPLTNVSISILLPEFDNLISDIFESKYGASNLIDLNLLIISSLQKLNTGLVDIYGAFNATTAAL